MANNKGKDNQKGKKSASRKIETSPTADFFDGFGKLEMTSFFLGLFISLFALFMLVAFVSYLFTGEADYSLLEQSANIMNDDKSYKNICGSLGAMLAFYFLNDLFGLASFIIPPYLIIVSMRLMRIFKFTLVRKFILSTLFMLWVSVFLAAFGDLFPYFESSFIKLGGNHGTNIVHVLTNVVGRPGLCVLLILYAVCFLIYLSTRTVVVIRELLRLQFLKKLKAERLKNIVSSIHKPDEELLEGEQFNDELEDQASDEKDASLEELVDDTPTTFVFERSEAQETKEEKEEKVQDCDQTKDNTTFIVTNDDPVTPVSPVQKELDFNGNEPKNDEAIGEMAIESLETEKGDGNIVRGDINTPYDPKLDLEMYKYPPLSLLNKSNDVGPQIDMAEQNANKDRIVHVLKSFGVDVTIKQATIGPTITLYEIVPSEGTKISKIRNLEDDIALSLSAEGIRIIAPIPGRGTIGIEVPNKKKCMVSMESILNSRVYQESTMELPCALGKTISNEVFMFDLAKAPHLLVAGATGQGKSVGLNAIITSLLYKKHPAEMKIVMVDPKKVEFSIYGPIENHFLARLEEEEDCIITDVQKVVKTLNSLCQLMDSRYDLLKKAAVRNIKEYNEKFKNRLLNPEHGHEFMPYIVVVVDEFGDLIMTAGKEVELPICRIAQLARAVGIHMIIATQRPQASIISGAIKTNFPTRIAFKVSSMMDSRVILDRPGANQLIGKGDLLYLQGGDPTRVQCAFVDTPEVNDICHFIARQQSYLHPMFLPEVIDADSEVSMGTIDKGHLDPMFADVAKFVVNNQNGSTSMIQRNFSIGYNRAGKLMDQLERMGVVGAQQGSKPREVLIKDPLTLESVLNTLN